MIKKDRPIASFIVIDDPIEQHIVMYLDKLRQQNIRFKNHIEKTAAWTHLKDVSKWKPYDFYNYFCTKYREKYKREYHITGSVVRAYNKIEDFVKQNSIPNNIYKDFIDLSFSRYFNSVVIPILGNMCSPSLFDRLMNVVRTRKTDDAYRIEKCIHTESEAFEDEIRKEKIYGKQPVYCGVEVF